MKKIIWAIESHLELDRTEKTIIETLKALMQTTGAEFQIEPVHVIPEVYIVAADIISPMPIFNLKRQTLELLKRKLAKVDLPGLLPPQVVYEPRSTQAQSARALVRYAEEAQADLIVVGTRAKRGLARLFLGSFAESLLLDSLVPVFTVNPSTRTPKKFGRILFPTDFEDESKAVFGNLLDFAGSLGASIVMYNVIINPVGLSSRRGLTAYEREYLKNRRERAQRRADAFLQQANEAGVSASYTIAVSSAVVSQEVVKYAKRKKIQLIAMAARSGRISSALTGSVTRQVVRESLWPVWVLRERRVAKRSRKVA